MAVTSPAPFTDAEVTLPALRARTSAKWREFDPDVLPAWVAEMDFPLAPPIADALHTAITHSDTGYAWPEPVAHSLSAYAARHYAWSLNPSRVLVVADVMTGVAESLRRLTEPGDGVVITTPVYPPFFTTVQQATGRRIVEVPLARDGHAWTLDLDALERAFADASTTAMLLCNPHNPTGSAPTPDELAALAHLARRHGITVISDEIHAPLAMPGHRFTPYLSIDADTGDDVALLSATKGWNLPGLKCAQLIAGSDALAEQLRGSVPIEVQHGAGHLGAIAAVAAYDEGQPWLNRAITTIAGNHALLADLLAPLGLHHRTPAATYLAWVDLSPLNLGPDPAATLLERGRVAVSSGIPFGAPGWVRLNLGTTPTVVREIVERMAASVTP